MREKLQKSILLLLYGLGTTLLFLNVLEVFIQMVIGLYQIVTDTCKWNYLNFPILKLSSFELNYLLKSRKTVLPFLSIPKLEIFFKFCRTFIVAVFYFVLKTDKPGFLEKNFHISKIQQNRHFSYFRQSAISWGKLFIEKFQSLLQYQTNT